MVAKNGSRGMALTKMLAAAAVLSMSSAFATAQDQPAAPAAPEAQSPWLKICNKDPASEKELCLVTQELHAENGIFIASATLRQFTGDSKISFITAVPIGMMIQPGVRVQVDEGPQTEMKYGVCFPNACYAELEVNAEFIGSLKRGNQLIVTVVNPQAKGISFPMSLAGFTKTFDGAGLDVGAAQERQNELNRALQERAEEARRRLIEQQQGGNQGN